MYAVSEAYRQAMHGQVHRFRLRGTIGPAGFSEDNILAGSFSITNQCSGNDTVEIGQVYIGELNATFLGIAIPRNSWKDRKILPVFSRKLPGGDYEEVPLGAYTVSTADWTSAGVVVKAYDNMALLDRPCLETLTNATPYEMLQLMCTRCEIQLGNTEEEIRSFANGTKVLSMYTENDIETWRDALSWLSQALGCFATVGRDGLLYLRIYGSTPADTLDTGHRFQGASFSDFSTYYTGISVVNIAEGTTSYYGLPEDDGLTMNLGSNPFLQYGVQEELELMRREVLEAISGIHYVPFKVKLIGDPAYDLGDCLLFTDGLAGDSALGCITKYVFKYNGPYEATGVGSDPALATARSKTDKNLSGLISVMDDAGMHFAVFRNIKAVTVKDGSAKSVLPVRFATVKTTHVQIYLEIHAEVTTTVEESTDAWTFHDAVCTVSYYLNGTLVEDFVPVETWQDGKHILTLHYDIEAVQAQLNTFDVWLAMSGGSLSIDKMGILEVVGGPGMAASVPWDGTIYAEETLTAMEFRDMFRSITDKAMTAYVPRRENSMNEHISGLQFTSMFRGIGDLAGISNALMIFNTTVNKRLVETECTVANGAWQGAGSYHDGTALPLVLPALGGIQQMKIICSGSVRFLASFDGGESWYGYNGSEWESDSAMLRDDVMDIPFEAWQEGTIFKAVLESSTALTEIQVKGGYLYAEGTAAD